MCSNADIRHRDLAPGNKPRHVDFPWPGPHEASRWGSLVHGRYGHMLGVATLVVKARFTVDLLKGSPAASDSGVPDPPVRCIDVKIRQEYHRKGLTLKGADSKCLSRPISIVSLQTSNISCDSDEAFPRRPQGAAHARSNSHPGQPMQRSAVP